MIFPFISKHPVGYRSQTLTAALTPHIDSLCVSGLTYFRTLPKQFIMFLPAYKTEASASVNFFFFFEAFVLKPFMPLAEVFHSVLDFWSARCELLVSVSSIKYLYKQIHSDNCICQTKSREMWILRYKEVEGREAQGKGRGKLSQNESIWRKTTMLEIRKQR